MSSYLGIIHTLTRKVKNQNINPAFASHARSKISPQQHGTFRLRTPRSGLNLVDRDRSPRPS